MTTSNPPEKHIVLYGPDGLPVTSESIKRRPTSRIRIKTIGKIASGVLAILGVGWGFYTYYVPRSQPDLYLTLSPSDETEWDWDQAKEEPHRLNPVEEIVLPAQDPDTFCQATLVPCPENEFYGRVAAKFYILNRGNVSSSDVSLKVYIPPELPMRILGSESWNTGYEPNRSKTVASYQMTATETIEPSSVANLGGILALDVPPKARSYELTYSIIGAGQPIRERTIKLTVTTNEVSAAALANFEGLEYLKKNDYERALIHFRKAVAAEPDNAAYNFNAGTALLDLDRPQEAEPYLMKAKEISPDIGEIWGNLGMCLLAQHKLLPSLHAFDHAIQINPQSEIDIENRKLALQMLGR